MIRAQPLAALALGVVLCTVGASAQSGGSLKGAWRVVAVTAADGKIDSSPQPGLYVFTDRHYSIQRVTAARAAYPEKPTDKDKVAAFDPFIANAGSYEVKGNVLMTKVLVSKNPNVMTGPGGKSELKFEGTSTVYVTSTSPAGAKTVVKLQRVE
jgi:hypothetical protein